MIYIKKSVSTLGGKANLRCWATLRGTFGETPSVLRHQLTLVSSPPYSCSPATRTLVVPITTPLAGSSMPNRCTAPMRTAC